MIKMTHITELPPAHTEVIETCVAEAWINIEAGDAHTAEDVAADIAERLFMVYGVKASPSRLSSGRSPCWCG